MLLLVRPYRAPFFYQIVAAMPHWPLSALQGVSLALPYSCHTRCRCFSTGHSCLVQSLHPSLSSEGECVHLVLDQLDIAFVRQISYLGALIVVNKPSQSTVIKQHKIGSPWSAVQYKEWKLQFFFTQVNSSLCSSLFISDWFSSSNTNFLITRVCYLYTEYVDKQQTLVTLYSLHIMYLLMTYVNTFIHKAS